MYMFDHEATEQTPALRDYRFIGNVPKNYVKFNGDETWRIIGVFDVDDGTGNYEERVKLIRNDSVGDWQWSNNNANEWTNSSLKKYLNNEYDEDNRLDTMVDTIKYYLGGLSSYTAGNTYYQTERGTAVSNDRSTFWIGKLGLMYSSDYVLTYAFGANDKCYSDPVSCKDGEPSSGWLYESDVNQWTLTPYPWDGLNIAYIRNNGNISFQLAANSYFCARPVLYLKPNVKIKSGDGTIDNPYEFEL